MKLQLLGAGWLEILPLPPVSLMNTKLRTWNINITDKNKMYTLKNNFDDCLKGKKSETRMGKVFKAFLKIWHCIEPSPNPDLLLVQCPSYTSEAVAMS